MKVLPALIGVIIAGGGISFLVLYYQAQPRQDIVSRLEDAGSLPVVFRNATNITNNKEDSVYGQVAAWDSSVFILWQDSIGGRNYDIFMKKSADNGTTFDDPINISNNPGFSEHPQLSAHRSNVYAVWADDTSGNREVLFARSTDGGASFENAQNLSKDTSDSHNQEIASFNDNVYVTWLAMYENESSSILLRASNDGGATFGRTVEISDRADTSSFPKVAANGDDVYLTWNVIGDGAGVGLYFVRSSDRASSFQDVMKLGDIPGESQVAAHNDRVYVVSGGLDAEEVNGLFFLKSIDGGETFADPLIIDMNGKFVNPLNVEVVSDNQGIAYVAGQVFAGGNEEILLLPISGKNATGIVNLSKNEKTSECPSIAMAGDNIYVVWEDLTPGNHEVLYARGIKK